MGSARTRNDRSSKNNRKLASDACGGFEPRTEFGRRLWSIRQKIVLSGQPLLDWDGVERELLERRGEESEEL